MTNEFQSDSHKDPDKLEREIDEQRANLSDTLRVLEEKFSPGQIVDQVLQYTRSNSGEFSRNLVDTIKMNPMPTLLTATGLVWMMIGQNRSPFRQGSEWDDAYPQSSASYGVDPSYQGKHGGDGKSAQLRDKAGQLREGASHSMDSARQRIHGMSDSARHGVQEARHQAHRASAGFEHLLREQPLTLGAMGIALGALLGAVLPRTQKEDELFGETRDQVAGEAARTAKESYEKASQPAAPH